MQSTNFLGPNLDSKADRNLNEKYRQGNGVHQNEITEKKHVFVPRHMFDYVLYLFCR